MSSRVCRFCVEPIEMVEPKDACGWAHIDLSDPKTLRFWCGVDDRGEDRRVEPRGGGEGTTTEGTES